MKKHLAIVGISLTLGACVVGPNYKRPQVAVPADFAAAQPATRPGAEVGTRPAEAGLAEWWRAFGDEQLDHVIELAIRSNLDLRIADARVREARAQLRFTRASLFPQVDAVGGVSRRRFSENGGFAGGGGSGGQGPSGTEQNLFQSGFDANWEIDFFGRSRRGIEAVRADYEGIIEDRRDVLVSLLAEVARNYLELRGAQRQLAVLRENIHAQSEVVEITTSRFKAGLIGELDVAQARSLLATTQAQTPTLETAARQAIHRLGVLVGKDPAALAAELAPEKDIPHGPPEVPRGLPSDLLRRRPDIRRAEQALIAANARIGVATADLYPRFFLTGTIGLESVRASDFFDGGSHYWSIGPSVSWPVFEAGRIRSNIEATNARQEQARLRYEQAVLASLEDAENSLTDYANERRRYRTLVEAVEANRRAVALAGELYTRGLTGFINVLDAQASLFRTQDELVRSERDVSTTLVAVYKALGGGWEQERAGQQEKN